MKRIRCPKCENYLLFDETKYSEGQSLVFVCEHCGKQFSIRLGKTKMRAPQKEERPDEEEFKDAFGSITVIENVFGFKQVLPLQEGDNVIGRRCVGTNINTPIETSDMSMDRRHCIINVKRNKQGKQFKRTCFLTVNSFINDIIHPYLLSRQLYWVIDMFIKITTIERISNLRQCHLYFFASYMST